MLKLLKKELSKEDVNVLIWFNPWKAGSPSNIYECFFEQLIVTVKKYSKNAPKEITKYAKSLMSAYDDNPLIKLLNASDLLVTENNLSSNFEIVNSIIKNTGLRFVIIIDDLDRLTGEEILDVLKLIRNIANFENLFFVSAFDYEYVINTLTKSDSVSNAERYIQKIFQYVLPLPPIRKQVLLNEFQKMMETVILDSKDRGELEDALYSNSFAWHENLHETYYVFEKYLDNIRDVKRLVNSFQISYSILKDEVDLAELICMEILKLQFPTVFLQLSKYKLIKRSENNKNVYEVDKSPSEKYDEEAKDILSFLFNSFGKGIRSIIYPDNFLIHIHFQLFNVISLPEWNEAKTKSIEEFFTVAKRWCDEEKQSNLLTLLKNIIPQENYDDYLKHIKLMVLLEGYSEWFRNILTEDIHYLMSRIVTKFEGQRSDGGISYTISQKNMTTTTNTDPDGCPAEGLLKMLSGKWKAQIFRLAAEGPVRFSMLLRQLAGANKQSLSVAIREMEEQGLLIRNVISEKPLHIEYVLSEKGSALIPLFRQMETLI